jgi:DNA-binding GntR family transcriptional regulator
MILRKTINNAQVAYDYIRNAIYKADLKPGSHVTEKWLGENLDMSRTPVREAMIRLESEGLVTVINNRTIVTTISPVDIHEIFQLRLLLEPYATAMCVNRVKKEKIETIRKFTKKMLEQKKQTFAEDIHDLHRVIIEATENKRLINVMNNLNNQIMRLLNPFGYIPGRIIRSLEEHMQIIDAVMACNPEIAEKKMRNHIESNLNDLMNTANFHYIFKG